MIMIKCMTELFRLCRSLYCDTVVFFPESNVMMLLGESNIGYVCAIVKASFFFAERKINYKFFYLAEVIYYGTRIVGMSF